MSEQDKNGIPHASGYGFRRRSRLGDTTSFDTGELSGSVRSMRRDYPVLNVLGGFEAGRTIVLDRDRLCLGRSPDCDIPLVGRGISRTHLGLNAETDGGWTLTDENSRNGTYVNDQRVQRHRLHDGDVIRIGAETALKFVYLNEVELGVRLANYEASIRDPLTGIYNRRYFSNQLTFYTDSARRHRYALSVLLFDIDNFKTINDRYGHPKGDFVLKAIADCVTEIVRPEDAFCRYGGEEFALILTSADDKDAHHVAERIRRKIEELRFPHEGGYFTVTVSCGLSTARKGGPTRVEEIMEEADHHLYRAKREGRNRTVGLSSPRLAVAEGGRAASG